MKKILSIIFLFLTFSLYAETISEQKAKEIAINFFNGGQTKSSSVKVDIVWAGDDLSLNAPATKSATSDSAMPSIYILNRVDNDGFVVVAGDDRVRPILAYSMENGFDIGNMADGARFMLSCWCKEVEAVRSRQDKESISHEALITALVQSEDDLLYTTALWGQGDPFNREAPLMGGKRCVTGCLATAMAIIAYHNKWPVAGAGTTPEYTCSYGGSSYTIPANVLGRTYSYSSMLSDYSGSFTEAQASAVAAIMKDMGTAIKMQYSPEESYSNYIDALYAFTHYFGYSKKAKLEYASSYSYEEWVEVLKSNLRNYGPTFYTGQSYSDGSGGHAFVLDGYNSQDYFHINFGWGGASNGNYYLPAGITYDYYQRAILNLEPDLTGTSTYTDHIVSFYYEADYPGIRSDVSNFVKNEEFNIYFGGVYNIGLSPFSGNFAIRLYDKDGNLKEILKDNINFGSPLQPNYTTRMNAPFGVTITENIEPGDRIKVYYDGENSDWQLLRPYDGNAVSEIVVMALNAAEIQRSLNIQYEKPTRTLYFYSDNISLSVYVEDEESQTVISPVNVSYRKTGSINMSELSGGTYKVVFASGSVEYELVLVLPDPPAEPLHTEATSESVVEVEKGM